MFFDYILLHPQHRGQFCEAWISATRGIKYLSRTQIKEVDVVKICSLLEKFIMSESGTCRKRFSLRLSAILIHGTIKIFREQVIILQAEIFSAIQTVRLPALLRIIDETTALDEIETPPTPKPKIKTKKIQKRIICETPPEEEINLFEQPNIQLPALEDVLPQIATSDLITLREEMRRPGEFEDEYPLGILTDKELAELDSTIVRDPEIPEPALLRSPLSDPVPPPQVIEVIAEVHVPKGKFIEDPTQESPIADIPRPEIVFPEEIIELSKEVSQEILQQIQPAVAPIQEEVLEPVVLSERSILKEIQTHQIPLAKKTKKVVGEKSDGREIFAKKPVSQEKEIFLIKRLNRVVVRINRCNKNGGTYFDKGSQLEIPFKNFQANDLYVKYWFDDTEVPGPRAGSSFRSSVRESGLQAFVESTDSKRSTLDKDLDVETPVKDLPKISFPQREETPKSLLLHVVEEPPALSVLPSETEIIPSTRKPTSPPRLTIGEIPLQVEPSVLTQTDIEDLSGIPREPPRKKLRTLSPIIREELEEHRFTEPRGETYKHRHQKIIDIVGNWDYDRKVLTIEDLCMKPFRKFVMSQLFSDLLALCSKKFVILKHKEDSLELESIEKGPKFFA